MLKHFCPAHGLEPCMMGEKALNHGCRQGLPLVFGGVVRDYPFAVITDLMRRMGGP